MDTLENIDARTGFYADNQKSGPYWLDRLTSHWVDWLTGLEPISPPKRQPRRNAYQTVYTAHKPLPYPGYRPYSSGLRV